MFPRALAPIIEKSLKKPYGLFLFGARQVGKTTLLKEVLKNRKKVWSISLQDYGVFQSYLKDPGLFKRQALQRLEEASKQEPLLLFIDEVQKIPHLLDECQWLYDDHKGLFHFIATGSSARKLRRTGMNLLPWRAIIQYLYPLMWTEAGCLPKSATQTILPAPLLNTTAKKEIECDSYLLYGLLPGILSLSSEDRFSLLQSYGQIYLKEEIQAEALIRSLEGFSRFLELAALESGNSTNYQKLSQEIGLKLNTIKNYYSILVDTLIAIPLEPYLKNARKRLITTPKIYFFDTGIRNAVAALPLERSLLKTEGGRLFEHFVILEVYRRLSYYYPHMKCYFWRTTAGAEVDLIIDTKKGLIPIEIKYTTNTRYLNLQGLRSFISDYRCQRAYVIGCFKEKEKLDRNIIALPWWEL